MRFRPLFFAALAAIGTAASPFLHAQDGQLPNVTSIEVQYAGPATISKQRILANMRTAVGRPYSDLAVEEDIRNLYATGNISNVRIFGEPVSNGVRVIVVVQTRSSVKEVRLEGITKIKTKRIRKDLQTKPGGNLSDANIEADRQRILQMYQERGFSDATVEAIVSTHEPTNSAIVTYAVNEGGKTIIKRIRFEGATVFKQKELRKVIKTRTHSILSFITKAGRLENEKLLEDVEALRAFYQNAGYLDVQVAEPQLERVPGRQDAHLIYPIVEGQPYHVGTVEVVGTQVLTREEILAELGSKPGEIYSPARVEEDVRRISDLYGSQGYVDVMIIPESTSAGNRVNNITYRVDEGSQSYVNQIHISGNQRTKDKVIRRELAVAPGEIYNTVRVDASRQRLTNLNYFERVDLFPSETGLPGRKDLNVVVNEKRTGSLNFGAGFSSIDSFIGFVELSQANFDITNWPRFTGGGQRFRTRVQYGDRRKDFIISLTEPYFMDYELAVGGELFYHDAQFLSSVYDQKNYGLNIFTRKAINNFLSWRLDYRLERIEIYNMDRNASNEMKKAEGDYLKSQITPALTYDSRDSVFLTRKGTRAELTTYLAGLGGDVEIYGFNIEASHYIHLPGDTILTLNGEVAAVDSYGGGDVPIFDRLYLGGANNLRGFSFRDISPKDSRNEPIGGRTMARITVEYTFPILDRVRGAVFYDAGIVNAGAYDFSTSNLASDAGIGVRLDLPIGPIRIDYGVPIQKAYNSGGSGRFNFNIGYQF